MNEEIILDVSNLEDALKNLKKWLNTNTSNNIASSLNSSLDGFLLDCHVIIEDIEDKPASMVWINDFRTLSKIFDIMWDLYKECVKKNPELISKLSIEVEELWKNARWIANTIYEKQVQHNSNDRVPYKIAQSKEKNNFLEEIKTYLTDENKKQAIESLEKAKPIIKKIQKAQKTKKPPEDDNNKWMANDDYSHWLTDN